MKRTPNSLDHAETPREMRRRSDAELHFIICDCRESLAAWPESPNAGCYLDEICYAVEELKRRRCR